MRIMKINTLFMWNDILFNVCNINKYNMKPIEAEIIFLGNIYDKFDLNWIGIEFSPNDFPNYKSVGMNKWLSFGDHEKVDIIDLNKLKSHNSESIKNMLYSKDAASINLALEILKNEGII